MSKEDGYKDRNYTYYDSSISLPHVSKLKNILPFADKGRRKELPSINDEGSLKSKRKSISSNTSQISSVSSLNNSNIKIEDPHLNISSANTLNSRIHLSNDLLFIPRPPSKTESLNGNVVQRRSQIKLKNQDKKFSDEQCSSRKVSDKNIGDLNEGINSQNKEYLQPEEVKDLANKHLIDSYTNYIENRYVMEDKTDKSLTSSDSEISISSLSDATLNDSKNMIMDNNLSSGKDSFEPLYSLPIKDKSKIKAKTNIFPSLNNVVLSSSKCLGSLPDLRSIEKFELKRVSHVVKNESEAESEPGAQIGYKFRPLPPIPGRTSGMNTSNLYETINGKTLQVNRNSPQKKSFREVARFLTLMPKLTTHSVRSRKNDHHLADISQYLPERKLKIFIGTWNMKGTKSLPNSLENFLLPMESIYLQDIYVIGTQEGTPFRREWQVRLQETFGPSHVLMQSSNFGVLQLSIFVRRELVWFCSSIEQDTTATRVGHKIKTKGALAMSFNVFGTSFLFITSHFTSHEGKLQDRINDYNSICENIQLPYRETKGSSKDVTSRFDRVFWFGDFNFRVKKARSYVNKLISNNNKSKEDIIEELLQCDQLNNLFERRKIFHGFLESPITFMPTYKFDVNTSRYDTSSKQRVPSWTDRVVHKSIPKEDLQAVCYNSCNSITVSDHRPVYAIFETVVEPCKTNFAFDGGQFDRDVYVEANMRRSAPSGTQEQSHVCIIL